MEKHSRKKSFKINPRICFLGYLPITDLLPSNYYRLTTDSVQTPPSPEFGLFTLPEIIEIPEITHAFSSRVAILVFSDP